VAVVVGEAMGTAISSAVFNHTIVGEAMRDTYDSYTTGGKLEAAFQVAVFLATIAPGNGAPKTPRGKVYRVAGDKTPTGKPYIGRTKQSTLAKRGKRDGRDRTDAEVVGTYDPKKAGEARKAEQTAMNKEGGLEKLDNKRNEIRPKDWKDNGIEPPQ
jgi:hypothetical protein